MSPIHRNEQNQEFHDAIDLLRDFVFILASTGVNLYLVEKSIWNMYDYLVETRLDDPR